MSTVEQTFLDAVLADIVYVYIDGEDGHTGFQKGMTDADLAELIAPRITEPLAQKIGVRFKVLAVHNDPGSNYQGVIFKDINTGDVILANRGTTPGADIYDADFDLAMGSGVATNQIVSMANWWNNISKPIGTKYTLLKSSDSGSTTFSSGGIAVASGDADVQKEIASAISSNKFRVVGHSLGGHLTTVFSSLFHDQVSSSSTFNGAGIFSAGSYITTNAAAFIQVLRNLLTGGPLSQAAQILGINAVLPQNKQSNYFGQRGISLTTNDITFTQVGNRIGLENELSINPFSNHFMYKLTDLLAVYSVYSSLDNNLSLSALNEFTKASSNHQISSIENLLDYIRGLFGGTSTVKTPATDDGGDWEKNEMPNGRVDFYTNLNKLIDSKEFQQFAATKDNPGKLKISITPADIHTKARTDFSALVSLLTLSPIYLTGKDSAAQSALATQLEMSWKNQFTQWKDDAGKADKDRVFTDAYLKDRADMLSWVVQGNLTDSPSTGNQMSVTAFQAGTKSGLTYTDTATNSGVAVTINGGLYQEQYDNSRTRELHSVCFGSDTNDTLSGERQYGGAGNDILKADTKTTYLEGGEGKDTYQLVSGSHCIILDCDGQGVIQIDGKAVSGVFVVV